MRRTASDGDLARLKFRDRQLDMDRTTLTACLSLNGVLVPHARRSASVDPEALLRYVREYPGQRGEQIASALATDSTGLRGTMKRLVDAGTIKTKGQRRGVQYWAARATENSAARTPHAHPSVGTGA